MESLGTKDLAEAKERANARSVEVDLLFREARAKLRAGEPSASAEKARMAARDSAEWEAYKWRSEEAWQEDAPILAREPYRQALITSLNKPEHELTTAQLAMRDLIDEREFDPPEVKAAREAAELAERRAAEVEVAAWFERGLRGESEAPAYRKLADVFEGYAQEVQLAPATYKRWKPVVSSFIAHLGHDDVAKVTQADVVKWKDALLSERSAKGEKVRGAKTVREVFLAALKVVLEWGVSNGQPRLPSPRSMVFG